MFDKKTLEEMQKAMQALQGMKSGFSDMEAAMKQLQAMKQMGIPGMDEAIKQMQDAQAMIAQGGMAAAMPTKAAKVNAPPAAVKHSQSKPVGRTSQTTNNIEFTTLGGGLK